MDDRVRASRGLKAACLGMLAWVVAAAPALGQAPAAPGQPFAEPLADLGSLVFGVRVGIDELPYHMQASAEVGWGAGTRRVHWRLGASRPLGLYATARLGYQDWPDAYLLGQARETGLEAGFDWQVNVSDQVDLRLFVGRVGRTADVLDRQVSYGWLGYGARLVYSWPFELQVKSRVVYGRAEAYPPAEGQGGAFYALSVALPARIEHLRIIPRLGYSAGEQALPGWLYRLGGYGDGWLRGYRPGTFSGPILLNGTLEYRRPWLESLQMPVISQVEVGPFLDAGATAEHGRAWTGLDWHYSCGLTAAVPLSSDLLLGADLAWNDQGGFRAGLRMSGEF